MQTYFCTLAVCRPPSDLCPAPSKDPTTLTTQEVTHHHLPQPQMKLCFPVKQTSLVLLPGSSMFVFWVFFFILHCTAPCKRRPVQPLCLSYRLKSTHRQLQTFSQPGWFKRGCCRRRPRASPPTVSNLPCLPPPPRALAIHGATMATPPSLPRNRLDPAGRHGYGLL